MGKSPDKQPFLAVYNLRLASANSKASPYRTAPVSFETMNVFLNKKVCFNYNTILTNFQTHY